MKYDLYHETNPSFDRTTRDRALHFDWDVDPDAVNKLVPFPPYKTKKGRHTMAAIISDAIVSAKRQPGKRISYARNSNWYAEKSRYFGPDVGGSKMIIECVDRLVEAGILVEHDKRPPTPFATGIQSSFLPAPFLKDLPVASARRKIQELMHLKDDHGALVDYRDTHIIERERRFIRNINSHIAESEIHLDAPDGIHEGGVIRFPKHVVIPDSTTLYRVYNGSVWTLGGRFYGGYWQNVSKENRKHFRIDGQKVVEEDYAQIHPSMLYEMSGHKKEGDAYDIPGWDRNMCKVAFNVLINANGWTQAHGALMGKGNATEADPMWKDLTHEGAKQFIEDVKKKHPKIRKYFHSGMGLRLQSFDSQMCRKVLSHMTIKNKATCLPVHDSFIVQEAMRDELVFAMQKAWDEVMPKLTEG